MVTSRTFAGDTGDEADDAIMTPMMDLLNHHWSGSTMIWDTKARSATLKASRDLEPGDEIYVNYGEKGSLEVTLILPHMIMKSYRRIWMTSLRGNFMSRLKYSSKSNLKKKLPNFPAFCMFLFVCFGHIERGALGEL